MPNNFAFQGSTRCHVNSKLQSERLQLLGFFFFFNLSHNDLMWKNTADPDRPNMTIYSMRIPCGIPMGTNTNSQYVILSLQPFHCDNGCTYAPQCYIIRALSFLTKLRLITRSVDKRHDLIFYATVRQLARQNTAPCMLHYL